MAEASARPHAVTPRRRLVRLWAPVALYMAGIFYVSSLAQPPVPAGSDKPIHAVAYFGLAIVLARAVGGGLPPRATRRGAATVLAIGIAYATSDEVHQMFVDGRTADARDLVADVVGVIAGTALCWAWGIIAPASRDEL